MSGKAMRAILHVDMDAFYASVEQRDDPSLRGKPLIIGYDGPRGVVSTASYEARKFGARSAMAMSTAKRLCPQATIVLPRHSYYAEVSAQIFAIFHRYTPQVEGLSLDEAFLDVTGSQSLFGSGEDIAKAIRKSIEEELALTASAGVASSKFVAKIASDFRKPNGLTVVKDEDTADFLAPLPIQRMWGLGPKSAERAKMFGLQTFADLIAAKDKDLVQAFGEQGPLYKQLALGIDNREVVADRNAKSIGAEITLEEDITALDMLEEHLLAQSIRVSSRLHRNALMGTTLTLKIKYHDFQSITRSRSSADGYQSTDRVFEQAREMLRALDFRGKKVRLIGVSVSKLGPQIASLAFEEAGRAQAQAQKDKADAIMHALRERFGKDAITRGTLVKK